MIRSLLASLIVVVSTPFLAQAEGMPAAEAHPFSVSTGLGFMSSIGTGNFSTSGFLWQADAQYFFTPNIAGGVFMQVTPFDGGTIFNLAIDGRYYFPIADKLAAYGGVGFGLAHAGSDFGGFSDNGALFSFIVGAEYDIMEQIALTTDMRMNAIAGNSSGDSFLFTWQLIGARYRF